MVFGCAAITINRIFSMRVRRLNLGTRRLISPLGGIVDRLVARTRSLTRIFIRDSNTLATPTTLVFL